jgi:hypothetical protein
MKLSTRSSLAIRRRVQGMTLVELLVAAGVSLLVLSAILSLYLFGLRSFGSMANYTSMDSQSRQSMDLMLREMRQASQVLGCQNTGTTQWLTLVSTNPAPAITNTFTWDSVAGTISWDKTGLGSRTVLTGCSRWSYNFFSRVPGSNYVFTPTADLTACKLIQMSWTCVRSNTFTPVNSENIVTAEVVLRNKQ